MFKQTTPQKTLLIGLFAGAALALLSMLLVDLFSPHDMTGNDDSSAEKKPLYWVAPMDPNYKRDKPGKSPMGMDLIPVYAEGSGASDSGPGTISIAPEVVNNLGVRTAEVVRRELHTEIKTVGYVQYDEDKLVHIHPRVEGWVEKLYVKAIGDPVKAGQPLYEIYSPALVNAQEELLLALERNNQRLIKASEERLAALQIPSEAIAQLKNNRRVSQRITFYAPQSGVVDNLNIRQGFFVKPGLTLMSIGALDQVWVEAEIFERQVPFVKTGAPVTMTLDYLPAHDWQGQVDYIYPTLDPKTRTVKVRLKFNNRDDLLKPNMFAQIVIHAERESATLVVPKEAVIRTGNQDRVVLALTNGRFKSVAVKVGLQDDNHMEILSGVSEGEFIVVSAQFLLDSESSKTSDFKRMQSLHDAPRSVWTAATIQSVDGEARKVYATHEPIEQWQWPAMTMNFSVADSVDFAALKADMRLHIEISQTDAGGYQIDNIHLMGQGHSSESEQSPSIATVTGVINSIDETSRVINISRGPIAKWNRGPATLDFILADELSMPSLKPGMTVEFSFEKRDANFVILAIAPLAGEE